MKPQLKINTRCIKCDSCRLICPEDAILIHQGEYHIETWSCSLCFACQEICPADAIRTLHTDSSKNV